MSNAVEGNLSGPAIVIAANVKSRVAEQGVVGALRGITLGGVTSILGDSVTRHMQAGVREEFVQGNPAAPSLALDFPGFWRFRWGVVSGTRTISINMLQVSNLAGLRPSIVVKANSTIGVSSDVTTSAGSATGWIAVGPITINPTGTGVLWVELHNNDTNTFQSTAYFDHIVTT